MKITSKIQTPEKPFPRSRLVRKSKIGRLPKAVRDELNRRLLDGESGSRLVKWVNEQPEARQAVQREFAGRPISEQNLSEWKQTGFPDWVARMEASACLAETLQETDAMPERKSKKRPKTGQVREGLADRVADWFFPHYVAAARGQMAAADSSEGRWEVLRLICADLARLRRGDHYLERLRLWQAKLELDSELREPMTEEKFLEWARKNDSEELERKIFPHREHLTDDERQERIRQILGLGDPEDNPEPEPAPVAPENPGQSNQIKVNPA